MATNTQTTAPTKPTAAAPKAAPTKAQKAAAAKAAAAATLAATNGVAMPAPIGAKYLPNLAHKGCPTMRGHRAYAWATVLVLAKAMPQGFALNQLKAALVGNVLPATHALHAHGNIAAPSSGWQAHNMPQWGARPANGWWLPVASK